MDKKELINKMKYCTVLYVEDELDVRKHIVEYLNRYFKKIYVADNCEDALDLYKIYKPNIILLDINLPGMNGIDFATLIRKNDSKTRIIMTTAYTNKEFMVQAIELDLTRYLVKPVTGTDLFSATEKAIVELDKNSSLPSIINLGENFFYQHTEKNILNTKDSSIIILRKKEIQLLEFFINKKNETVTYEVIETQIWPDDIMTEDAIRSQIRNIRNKTYSKILKNISGVGYKLCVMAD